MPLEELAAIFGDTDEVKIYSSEITVNDDGKAARDADPHTGQSLTGKDGADVVLHEKV